MRNVKPLYQKLLGCVIGLQLLCAVQTSAQNGYVQVSNSSIASGNQYYQPGKSEATDEKQTLLQVLKDLNRKKGVYFLFSENNLGSTVVNEVKNPQATVEKILDDVLNKTGLKYKKISDKTFVILNDKEKYRKTSEYNMADLGLVSYNIPVVAVFETIRGKIIAEEDGSSLPGVSISIKGTGKGTSTDANGNFSIEANKGDVLVISIIGYITQQITIGDETNLSINLVVTNKQLSEVVVTALGISRKSKTLVYATQTVKPAELTGVRDPNNILNSLSGKIANAVITQGSGGPGSGAKIVLRGNRSIQQSNNALIVVDGIPILNPTYGTAGSDFGSVQGSDGASNINPDDIESVTVLRGASAAALYGSEAGNGVIVITTKKGKKDKIAVDINSGIAFERAFSLPEFQNSYGQGSKGILDATAGASWGAKMSGQSYTNHLGKQSSYSAQPDNIKDFFRTGISLNNSIGISGGGEKMQTYFSYTNNNISGIVRLNNLMRNTINLRITNQISKKLSTDAKVTYIDQHIRDKPRTGEENAPVMDIYEMPRNVSTADTKDFELTTGIPKPTPWPSTNTGIYQNPYWMIYRTAINEKRSRIMGFASMKYQLTDWLSITGRANLDRMVDNIDERYSEGTTLWAASGSGGNYRTNDITTTQQWYDVILSGNNKIANDFQVNYNAGAIFQDISYTQTAANATGLLITNKFTMAFAKAPSVSPNSGGRQVQSVFGQANFSFRDAIFLDMSLRNDWDSRLPSPYSFQYYSAGASAILSDLMKLPSAISFLKASVNYAEVGNGGQEQIRFSTYNFSQGAGNGLLGRNSVFPLPDLKPEIVRNIEAGIEARFMNDRFGFTATYYKTNSSNQLLRVDLPVATGYGSKYLNAGNIQNSGIELVINASPIKSTDLNWDIALNFSTNKNKVIKLSDDVKRFPLGGGYARSATPIVEEGKSYGDLLAFGWNQDAKGNYVVSATGLPVQTPETKFIGNFNPKQNIGLTNSLTYKRFSFRLLLDGRIGGTVVSGTEMNLAFSGITKATENFREGGWNLGGVNATGQPVSATISSQDYWTTVSGQRYGWAEFFAYKTTSFRARELSLGYEIPISGSLIKAARFSAVARNLFWIYRGESTLDVPGLGKRKMWFDPDMSIGNGNFQGTEYGTLPSTRSIGFNLKLSF